MKIKKVNELNEGMKPPQKNFDFENIYQNKNKIKIKIMKIKKVEELNEITSYDETEKVKGILRVQIETILEDEGEKDSIIFKQPYSMYIQSILQNLEDLEESIMDSVMDFNDDVIENEKIHEIYQKIIDYLSHKNK